MADFDTAKPSYRVTFDGVEITTDSALGAVELVAEVVRRTRRRGAATPTRRLSSTRSAPPAAVPAAPVTDWRRFVARIDERPNQRALLVYIKSATERGNYVSRSDIVAALELDGANPMMSLAGVLRGVGRSARACGLRPDDAIDVHLAAHRFNPIRLTVARELRGLTRVELAQRVDKTPSAISQFETGRSRPDGRTLAALALVLGMPAGFFARPECEPLALDACHFRTLRSASQRERRRLLSIGTLLSELVDALDEIIEFPAEGVSRAAANPANDEEIEACAEQVRVAWGLGVGPIPNVTKLLQSKGVLVCSVPNTCSEVDAFSAWHRRRPMIFLVADRRGTRMRFDASHELGHLVMHADVTPGSHEVEQAAHRFASAFIFPRSSFQTEWPRWLNWDQIFELKQRWGMSAAAMVRRAYDLGLVSEASYRRANIRLRQHGLAEPHEPPSEYPSFLTRALELLDDDFSKEDLASLQQLSVRDIDALIGGEVPGELAVLPPDLNPQLSLLGIGCGPGEEQIDEN